MKVYFTGHVLRDILKFFSIPELPLFHPCRTEVHVACIVKWACYAQVISVLTIKDFAIWTVPYMQMPLSWLRFLFAYLRVFYVGGFHWSIYENKIINHICDEASVFVVVSMIERLHLGWSGRKPLSRLFIGKPLNVRLWKFWGVQLFFYKRTSAIFRGVHVRPSHGWYMRVVVRGVRFSPMYYSYPLLQ